MRCGNNHDDSNAPQHGCGHRFRWSQAARYDGTANDDDRRATPEELDEAAPEVRPPRTVGACRGASPGRGRVTVR